MRRRRVTWIALIIVTTVIAVFMHSNTPNDAKVSRINIKPAQHEKTEYIIDTKTSLKETGSVAPITAGVAEKVTPAPKSSEYDGEIQMKAERFYEFVFPGMVQDAMGDLAYETYKEAIAGNSLLVEDFFKKKPLTKLVPLISGDKILAVSVFRRYDGKIYKPAQLLNVSKNGWSTFPPVSQMEAESLLVNEIQNSYVSKLGFVHINGVSPNYQFVVPSEDKTVYLVDAFTGKVNVFPVDFKLLNPEEDTPPVLLDNNGLLIIDSDKTKSWSTKEVSQLKEDIEESNAAIKEGLLKIGPDFEVIYDNRPKNITVIDKR
jgi:hypothetical protein